MKAFGIAVAVLIVIALGFAAWLVLIPGPMAFASGSTVALSEYKDVNPTGVPKELAQADLVKRGEYLAHAADCVACHTAPGAAPMTPSPSQSPSPSPSASLVPPAPPSGT